MRFLYLTLLTLLLSPSPITAASKKIPKNAILLSNVKTLTLRENAKTSARRVSAIPQLSCKGPACSHYTIPILRCTNAGSDYTPEAIQWSCSASLPQEFKLGSTDVICEGYDSPDDDYVLKGSCGVEYRLLYTEAGEEKYGSSWFGGGGKKEGWTIDGVLFLVLFVAVAGWILWAMYQGARNGPGARRVPRAPRGGGGWGGGGGGGGGGGDDGWDPPPPYPGKRTSQAEGWRPGPWSGAAAGAAAGYAAGRMGGNRQPEPRESGGWFGGGNRSGGSGWGAGPSRSSGSGSSGGGSSARHESTGFGSTSRR